MWNLTVPVFIGITAAKRCAIKLQARTPHRSAELPYRGAIVCYYKTPPLSLRFAQDKKDKVE